MLSRVFRPDYETCRSGDFELHCMNARSETDRPLGDLDRRWSCRPRGGLAVDSAFHGFKLTTSSSPFSLQCAIVLLLSCPALLGSGCWFRSPQHSAKGGLTLFEVNKGNSEFSSSGDDHGNGGTTGRYTVLLILTNSSWPEASAAAPLLFVESTGVVLLEIIAAGERLSHLSARLTSVAWLGVPSGLSHGE